MFSTSLGTARIVFASDCFVLHETPSMLRVFPAEHFPEGNRERHGNFLMYRRLRPELVKRNPEPLNSDAFSKFCSDAAERRKGDEGVVKATRRLLEKEVPKFAQTLSQMKAYELIDSQFNLCNEMHRRGVRSVCSFALRRTS